MAFTVRVELVCEECKGFGCKHLGKRNCYVGTITYEFTDPEDMQKTLGEDVAVSVCETLTEHVKSLKE